MILLVLGCVEPFQTPSAYDDERLLCDEARAWEARTADCIARDCDGVMSAAGVLDDSGFALNIDLHESVVHARSERIDRVELHGLSPYFHLALTLSSLGVVPGDLAQERELIADASSEDDDLSDPYADLSLHLSAVYQTLSRGALPGSDPLLLDAPQTDQLSLSFSADFGDGEWLEGCAVVRAAEIRSQ